MLYGRWIPSFPKPRFPYDIDVGADIERLRAHKKARALPARSKDHLLLASWNIANLGAPDQRREPPCFDLLAEMVQWFDLVSVVEVRRDVDSGIRELYRRLPPSWRLIFSEASGNEERMAYLWDSAVLDQGQLIGKAIIEPRYLKSAGGPSFAGFSRTPYVATFHRGELVLALVSVHSFFGEENDPLDMARRLAETKAIGWWCEHESKSKHSYTKDIVALGDFNTPSEDDAPFAEEMLAALRKRGLHTPRYARKGTDTLLETQIGTAVRSENHYDHLLYFPKHTDTDLVEHGVFDFDQVVFADLWKARSRADFHRYVVWALSDHRPLWARFKV